MTVGNLTRTHLATIYDPSITRQIFAEHLFEVTHYPSDQQFKDAELGVTEFCTSNKNRGQNKCKKILPITPGTNSKFGLKYQRRQILWGYIQTSPLEYSELYNLASKSVVRYADRWCHTAPS